MTAIRIDGNALAAKVRDRIAAEVSSLKARGVTPGLAVVLVGEDPASQVYVRNKVAACAKVGMHSVMHKLPAWVDGTEGVPFPHAVESTDGVPGQGSA